MRNFQDTFETRKGSFISTFSIMQIEDLKFRILENEEFLAKSQNYAQA